MMSDHIRIYVAINANYCAKYNHYAYPANVGGLGVYPPRKTLKTDPLCFDLRSFQHHSNACY